MTSARTLITLFVYLFYNTGWVGSDFQVSKRWSMPFFNMFSWRHVPLCRQLYGGRDQPVPTRHVVLGQLCQNRKSGLQVKESEEERLKGKERHRRTFCTWKPAMSFWVNFAKAEIRAPGKKKRSHKERVKKIERHSCRENFLSYKSVPTRHVVLGQLS